MIKLIDLLFENENKKVSTTYFQQTLNNSSLSAKNRKYIQDIINSVKKAGDMATPKQHDILQRLKTGNFKYPPKN
jgi:hypothetical protein